VYNASYLMCFLSSQVTDGAAAVLMMTRREALKRGLPVLGIFRSFAAVGVDPAIMGVGPAVAIPAAVEKVGTGLLSVLACCLSFLCCLCSSSLLCGRVCGALLLLWMWNQLAAVGVEGGACSGHGMGAGGACSGNLSSC
jgi:hypothetical protein